MKERGSLEGIKSTSVGLMAVQGLFLFVGVVKLLTAHDHVTEKFIWVLIIAGLVPMFIIHRQAVKGLKD